MNVLRKLQLKKEQHFEKLLSYLVCPLNWDSLHLNVIYSDQFHAVLLQLS